MVVGTVGLYGDNSDTLISNKRKQEYGRHSLVAAWCFEQLEENPKINISNAGLQQNARPPITQSTYPPSLWPSPRNSTSGKTVLIRLLAADSTLGEAMTCSFTRSGTRNVILLDLNSVNDAGIHQDNPRTRISLAPQYAAFAVGIIGTTPMAA